MILNFNQAAWVLLAAITSSISSVHAAPGTIRSSSARDEHATNNNIFDTPNTKWTETDDDSSSTHNSTIPHIGCAAFLKANHTSQHLKAVNFRGSKSGASSTAADADGDAAPEAAAANARVSCTGGIASGYPCSNIDLLSFIPLEGLGAPLTGLGGNDIWGWTHTSSGREFAIMGMKTGTSFVEITDPVNPVVVGFLPTHTSSSSWRDVKTYADHAFVVSEASGHGMQIFDLTQLLSSPPFSTFVETAHYGGFSDAHNIVINEDSGYAFAVGTNTYSGGLHIVNIQDPSNPMGEGGYNGDGYTHDAQCVNYNGPDSTYTGSEICFCYNGDTLTIVDVTTKTNPIELGRVGYTGSAYTHQGWLTDDGTHVVVNDEQDETGTGNNTETHVFNVENLDSPSYVGFHTGTTKAIDHNLYVKGDLVFESNYRAGLQVLQIDDLPTASFTQVANFDIYPASNSDSYNGAWSNYPYFPSGSIIVSGIEQGLFVLQSPNDFGRGTASPTESPTQLPTASPTVPPPTTAPTTSVPTASPTTSAPTGSPTLFPTSSPTTAIPTASPVPPPTSAPTTPKPTGAPTIPLVPKYICSKNDPGDDEICLNGSILGGSCSSTSTAGLSCGNGGRKCRIALDCPGSGPAPGPTPTPPPNNSCPVCGNGDTCCPGDGNCQTGGKPGTRACV